MTKLLALSLAGLTVLGSALAAGYRNAENGFSVTPPSGWTQMSVPGVTVAFADKPQGNFTPNLNVAVQPLPPGMTLAQYHALSLDQVGKLITDSKVISTRATTLGGAAANETIFTGRQGEYKLYFISTYTVKGGKAYLITATTRQGLQAKMTPVNAAFIKSFKILR
ncbi:PsbP-related protein [Deinococcus frigens]|uniref:PsbP-related protein n=1 Tax=Deinococcus frigens TaxID=249403 RepID=UPI0004971638|nr:DcrB-related protein [Deinococcus frigens]